MAEQRGGSAASPPAHSGIDWRRPAVWGRLAAASLLLCFVASMSPVFAAVVIDILARIGWHTDWMPEATIGFGIAFVLATGLRRSVGAQRLNPWDWTGSIAELLGTFVWMVSVMSVAAVIGMGAEMAAIPSAEGVHHDILYRSLLTGMVAFIGFDFVVHILRATSDGKRPGSVRAPE